MLRWILLNPFTPTRDRPLFLVFFFTFWTIKTVLRGFRPNHLISEWFWYFSFRISENFFLGYHGVPHIGIYIFTTGKLGKNPKNSNFCRSPKNRVLRSKISEFTDNSIINTLENLISHYSSPNWKNSKNRFFGDLRFSLFLSIFSSKCVWCKKFEVIKIIYIFWRFGNHVRLNSCRNKVYL